MKFLRTFAALLMVTFALPASAQLWDWSQNATLNANVDPSINWLEGMPPSAVNDSARATMAGVAKWRDDGTGLVPLAGTLTAYTASTNQGNQNGLVSSLVAGYKLCFSPNVVNGASPTLAVDGQVAKPLRLAPATNLVGGEMRIGTPYCATYFTSNGGEYILNEFYAPIIAGGSISYAQIQNVGASRLLGNPTGSPASMSEISLGQGLGFSGTSVIVPNLGVTTAMLQAGSVTYAKIQNETNATILGNNSGGSAAPEELTLGAGLSFSGTSVLIGTGAITSTMILDGTIQTVDIGNSQVTYGKIQNESNGTLLGNNSGGTAAPSEITMGAGVSLSGTTLTIGTGAITSAMILDGTIATADIGAQQVTYAKIQNVTNARILGNDTGSAASIQELSLDATLSFLTSTTVGIANGGVNTTQLAASGVTYAKIQNVAASKLLGNPTGSPAAPSEISIGTNLSFSGTTLNGSAFTPNIQNLTSGAGATYTTPTNGGNRPLWIRVRMCGGGGGGAAANTNNGAAGGTTTFGSTTALAGQGGTLGGGGTGGAGGTGGVTSTGTLVERMDGNGGASSSGTSSGPNFGGQGGAGPWGGQGAGVSGAAGNNAKANSCAGGGGASQAASTAAGAGGGSGEYVEFIITAPAASYTYTVGTSGAGGAAGTLAGGNGGTGVIIVEGYWQ